MNEGSYSGKIQLTIKYNTQLLHTNECNYNPSLLSDYTAGCMLSDLNTLSLIL